MSNALREEVSKALQPEQCLRYTYADILEWDEDVRAEIIDGELYMMGSPDTAHQEIIGAIFARLYEFLRGGNHAGLMFRPSGSGSFLKAISVTIPLSSRI